MQTNLFSITHKTLILLGAVALAGVGVYFAFSTLMAQAQEAPPVELRIHAANHASSSALGLGSIVHANVEIGTTSEATTTPTGTVEFLRYANQSCSGTAVEQDVALEDGEAESATTTLATSGLSYRVNYEGDENYGAASSGCVSLDSLWGTIAVDKVTNPASATTTFSFEAGGAAYDDFELTGSAASNTQNVPPGNYSIFEEAESGWVRNGATCSVNGATSTSYSPGAAFELEDGDTIECVFTNTQATSTPDDDDDDDDNGNGNGNGDDDDDTDRPPFFKKFLPPGIWKKVFGDDDFKFPRGIEKSFDKVFKNWDHDDNDDDDGNNDNRRIKSRVERTPR